MLFREPTEKSHGSLNLIIGPMWAGKTSELIRRYKRYSVAGKKCLLVKHENDDRYDKDKLCTHDSHKLSAVKCKTLESLKPKLESESYDVICIDEIQFYPDNLEFCEKMANNGIVVEASGLNGNYLQQPFPNMGLLMSKADNIQFLTAVCMMCKREGASFTKRVSNDKDEVVIGGTDKYLAVCRGCKKTFLEKKLNKKDLFAIEPN